MTAATALAATRLPRSAPPERMVPYPFTVDQYHRMIAANVFANGDRCELLEGWVVRKLTRNPPHDFAVTAIQRRLGRLLGDDWTLRVQCAATLAGSEPEPDALVARGPERRYLRRHPRARDIALVIEVAESSLELDRIDKLHIYAAARLLIYWIVNLIDGQVEVYSKPRAGKTPAYRRRHDFRPGDEVPVVLAGKEIGRLAVRELLP